MGGGGGNQVDGRNIAEIIARNGNGVAGNLFAGGRIWFGQNGNGATVFNSGAGWQPIGSAPADIRWLPGVTGNWTADQIADAIELAGGLAPNAGEGFHPVSFDKE